MDKYCDEKYEKEQEAKRKGMPIMVCPVNSIINM
jgi:hypothetical protein